MFEGLKLARSQSKTFSFYNRCIFYMEIADFLEKGVSLNDYFKMKLSYAEKNKHYSRFIFKEILKRLANGETIDQIMVGKPGNKATGQPKVNGYVPVGEGLLIATGVETGKLDDSFRKAKYLAEAANRLKSAIVSPLVYPLFLVPLGFLLIWFSDKKLFSELDKAVPIQYWPSKILTYREFTSIVSDYAIFIVVGFFRFIYSQPIYAFQIYR